MIRIVCLLSKELRAGYARLVVLTLTWRKDGDGGRRQGKRMTSYLPDLYERPVPRYTSYPTALEFRDDIGPPDLATALEAVSADVPISLYVHIPYCREICWYCGCNTGAIGRGDRLGAYVDALRAEIATVSAAMRGRVVSIHFGGGSPNVLPADMLAGLIGELRAAFATIERPEITVELDPRLASMDYAKALAGSGVTRASLGVQCFAPHVQTRINRVQPAAMVDAAVRDLRGAGIVAINFDLLHGLPAQTTADIADTIGRTIMMRPDRIALFGYAHNPRLLARQRMIDTDELPRGRERFEQAALAHDLLVAAGYEAIGFDHFALPGDPLAQAAREGRLRRNFQGFTDEPGEAVIGLGASAISQFPGLIAQNEKHVGRYRATVTAGRLATVRGVSRSEEDRRAGAVIERLLCDRRVDLDAVAAQARPAAQTKLRAWADRGLIEIGEGGLVIRPGATPYMRIIASAFDRYR